MKETHSGISVNKLDTQNGQTPTMHLAQFFSKIGRNSLMGVRGKVILPTLMRQNLNTKEDNNEQGTTDEQGKQAAGTGW